MKQLEKLGHQRVLDWAIQAMERVSDNVVLVVPAAHVAPIRATVGQEVQVVAGGESRAESVRAGLAAVALEATHVLVHDAARPLASPELVDRLVGALADGADGAIPVVPVTDTLRTVGGDPIDRSGFVAVQTPQGFRAEILRIAHAEGGEATDDATMVSRNGGVVVHTEGEPRNMKITVTQDLRIAEALL